MSKQTIALVDTNIWLDNYLGDRPGAAGSRAFLDRAFAERVVLCYAVTTAKDLFYIIAQALKAQTRDSGREVTEEVALAATETAWKCVENMREAAIAIGADEADLWLAVKYRPLVNDLEDNLIMAAAERAKADFIVTRDKGLLAKSTVAAHTPEDALIILDALR